MKYLIKPRKLDGTVKLNGIEAEYFNAANVFGNRVRVDGKKEIVQYLLAFSVKGTQFNLSGKEDFLPALAFAAAYACSDTVIAVNDTVTAVNIVKETAAALSAMGANTTIENSEGRVIFKVNGCAALKGGEVEVFSPLVALAATLAATCADNPCTIVGAEIVENAFPDLGKTLLSLGADISFE